MRDFRQLVAWQLAQQPRLEIIAATAEGAIAKDFRFCHQIRDASASAPRNIAEGFGRYRPREFARFLEIARASLVETEHHLVDARQCGYLNERCCDRLLSLARAARRTTTNLMLAKRRQADTGH